MRANVREPLDAHRVGIAAEQIDLKRGLKRRIEPTVDRHHMRDASRDATERLDRRAFGRAAQKQHFDRSIHVHGPLRKIYCYPSMLANRVRENRAFAQVWKSQPWLRPIL